MFIESMIYILYVYWVTGLQPVHLLGYWSTSCTFIESLMYILYLY